MSKYPLGSGFIIGMLAGAGLVATVGLVALAIAGSSRSAVIVVLIAALLAGLGGGTVAVGWVQSWRDAVRSLGSLRANPVLINRPHWPISLGQAHDRLELLTEKRDNAIAGYGFAQQRLEAIVSGLRDGVLVIGPDLSIVSINDAASRLLGSSPAQAIGRPLVEVARDFDLVRVARETVESGHEQSTPVDYRRAGRQLDLRVLPIEQGGRRLAVLVVQDVTELRRLERVRQDFVANVSHELRTPLTAIRALVETLHEGAIHDPAVAQDFLGRVVDEVDRLNELIEDLLDLGRLESGRLPLRRSALDVDTLVKRSLERVRHQAADAGVTIAVQVPDDLPLIWVDPSRMAQVLVNLLSNAIKFSAGGGRIEVTAWALDGTVQIAVRDYGAGILPEDLPRIFERFFKSDRARQSEGSGLGLAIAKHVVTAHGGTLTAESEYGKGSTFTICVPPAEGSAAA